MSEEPRLENAVAIVGMAGRFPEARTLGEFWDNLRHGVEGIRPIPEAALLAAGVSPETLADPRYVRAAGVLADVDLFDAPFFGFSAREAALLDPQHRLLLEVAWEAIEAAGYDAERLDRPVGVYAGASANAYFLHYLFSPREALNDPDASQFYIGNDNNFLATRTSYKLGLRGPSLTVQTACSTSLVAVHLACQSLLNGECDLALAGGVSVRTPQVGYFHRPGGILSPDGHCRAFDAAAAGSVFGSGVGVVALKRIEDALADRDPVRAIILGSALNNDGALRIGFTAPGVEGQSAAIAEALALAQVEPAEIDYVEAHGSGTPLGDPIEISALGRAFATGGERATPCAVGSVKSSVGHLDAAAGVTGLIKTVLALEHGEIPPSLHFSTPNPEIDFAAGPFYVASALTPWPEHPGPRRAGVSSFGMGGTNVHIVLEEAPPLEPAAEEEARPAQLLLLSAQSPGSLDRATENLAAHLAAHPEEALADVAHTLAVGRKAMRHRRALVAASGEEAARALSMRDTPRLLEGPAAGLSERPARPVAFLFPGLGEHYPGMGRGLYESEPAFRESIDRSAEILEPLLGRDLRELLYPTLPDGAATSARGAEGLDLKALVGRGTGSPPATELDRTAFAQPALFVTEIALAHLWQEWGVEPAALLGYSLGEYTAACLAGVFPLEEALRVVALRARAIEALPEGAMLAIPLPEAEVLSLLGSELSLTAVNGPELAVVGGPAEAVRALAARLAESGVLSRPIRTSHAFHSRMMQPAAAELTRLLAGLPLAAPSIPFLSNVTGTWITDEEATDPAYWVRHLLSPVRLADDLAALWQEDRVLLEVGPGGGLGSLALQHPGAAAEGHGGRVVVPSLPGQNEARGASGDGAAALTAWARLWLAGAAVEGSGLFARQERRRLRLPTYPFERQRHWVEAVPRPAAATPFAAPGDSAPAPAAVATTVHTRPALPTAYAEPQGESETALAALFQELLGVSPIGRHDSFFDLGGHSLLGAQLMSRVGERFAAEVPVQALFEAPTVARLAEILTTAPGAAAEAAIPPQPRDGHPPLSFAQERLWFLDRLIPDNPVYHVPLTTRLRGRLDRPALAAALDAIAARHEALRTTFATVDDRPVQVIAPALSLAPPVADLSALPEAVREPAALALLEREVARPFDLSQGPLARALLVRLAPAEHLALFNLHHVVSDGWSMGILLEELSALYQAFVQGRPSPLPPLPLQYADYAIWQRQWLTGERLESQVAWWREHLAGAPPVTDLPLDRPRPAVPRFQGKKLHFHIPAERLPGLAALEREHQATLFMVLLAGFAALLSRLSSQGDLVVGSPIAGRGRRELEGLIGFFVNTLALRADLTGDPTFGEIVERLKAAALGAFAHQDLPFERLVEEIQPERNLAHPPVFQAALVLLNAPAGALTLPSLSLETFETWVSGTKFDFTVSMWEAADGLGGYWEFDTDLFDDTSVARFVRHFETLLAAGVADPSVRLSEIEPLTPAERHQLRWEWNAGLEPGDEHTLHGALAALLPDREEAPALVWDGGSLTYGELDLRAGRLARRLAELGVGPEVPVALALERSAELVVALLAVLKAGGAYVPIDPHHPVERQAFMLEDSGARVVVTAAGGDRNLPALAVPRLDLGELDLGSGEPFENRDVPPDHLAYIMYTSGSTGRPKGVMIRHGNLVRLFSITAARFGCVPGDVFALFHSVAFDVSVWETWATLLSGARAAVVPYWVSRSPELFHALLAQLGVTVLNQTPQAFRQLAAADREAPPLSDLRLVILGGEALDLASFTPWWERYGAERPLLVNGYGITETAIYSTFRPVTPADLGRPGSPTGTGLPDQPLRLLDRRLRPVPMGVPGELAKGGPGVARGYHRRPELTAERFVPDPWGAPGARLYRSGDLLRYRPDGDLDYLGRLDHQVKIRGVRLELGEIEKVLESHPAVAQAVVLARQDGGDKQLVAYVVPGEGLRALLLEKGGGEITHEALHSPEAAAVVGELRDFVRGRLPEPMVPAAFTVVESLPTAPTGKIDRRALAARPVERAATAAYKAPADEIERQIAGIWQEVLKLDRVGTEDNFFDLGGHSLALVQVQRKIKERLSRDIAVVELFRTPTIAALARHLAGPGAQEPEATAAQQGDERAETRRAMRDRRRQVLAGRAGGEENDEDEWE